MISLLFLLNVSATDPLEAAIGNMRAAQDAIQAAPKNCADALKTQVKAARMQLELSKEAKDLSSAQNAIGGLRELVQEAKQSCPPKVSAEIEKAIAALSGQPAETDDDEDLKPDQPKAGDPPGQKPADPVPDTRSDTRGPEPRPTDTPTKPFISAGTAPTQGDLDQQVADAAKVLARGFTPVGPNLKGYGKRTDWIQNLDAGKCYAFVGVGAATTKRIALYVWDPFGKRRSDRRAREPVAVVYHCPFVGGPYRLQAKVKRPDGGYAVGIFVR